jgi:hypothetical protein
MPDDMLQDANDLTMLVLNLDELVSEATAVSAIEDTAVFLPCHHRIPPSGSCTASRVNRWP